MRRLAAPFLACTLALGLLATAFAAPGLKPPVAKKVPSVTTLHGHTRQDDYAWLRHKESPEVLDYLNAENAYSAAFMKPTEKLQKALYDEMIGHTVETDLSVPVYVNGYLLWSRTEKGKQYPILVRKKSADPSVTIAPDELGETYLDLNVLAEGQKFAGLGDLDFSDDNRELAYSMDFTGFRQYTLYVKDLTTGELGPERIPRVDSFAWGADNRTIFYVVEDPVAKRAYRLYCHTLGQTTPDKLLYEETDARFDLEVSRSRNRQYVVAVSQSKTSSEVRMTRADHPGAFQVVSPREPDHIYNAQPRGDKLYILTDGEGHRNRRVMTAPIDHPQKSNWQELVPERPDVTIGSLEVFADHYVLGEYVNGLVQVHFIDIATGASHAVEVTEPSYSLSGTWNPEFGASTYRLSYSSLVTPNQIIEYDTHTGAHRILKQQAVPGYDPSQYQAERIFATASDGTQVPISLVAKKGTKHDGKAPLFLDAYGSYGYANPPTFSVANLSLLDRGAIVAIAHIRGGGDLGRKWHDQGRMMSKRNTFTDFIACAEHLIAQKYTSASRLAIHGASAGGLLIGAVVNMRPDLFGVVVAEVPFVDVINTMLDEDAPLTVGEFEEWGNPKIEAQYDYMMTYSPYDNLAAHGYPPMLVITSLNDSQVMYWEPAKYVARLRALKTDKHPLLLNVNMAGGHGGSSGRYNRFAETAYRFAFALYELGISK